MDQNQIESQKSKPKKSSALNEFLLALSFIEAREEPFRTLDLQRHLRCGYSTACKVIDALIALCIIEDAKSGVPRKYRIINSPKREKRRYVGEEK